MENEETNDNNNEIEVDSSEIKLIKTTIRSEENKRDIVNRINRLAGSLSGIGRMVEDDRYCHDILIQLSAIDKSIKSLANRIIENHLKTCIIKNIKDGNDDVMNEVIELFKRFQ